ncbi:hypothetical protein TEA_004771 [Camellia sinensis var. sinensis]|uniref:Uncharacterized protein n=1 Tax=Camellia sinensis var. sinensis TaxID=542762 RepID=A0A4S4D311_CAMSN|nr:hypothetical protein TEA_004771 [Camellia sinensis var. sinensis]
MRREYNNRSSELIHNFDGTLSSEEIDFVRFSHSLSSLFSLQNPATDKTELILQGHGSRGLLNRLVSTVKRWFGEASPEAKAANNLHHFFTYVAVSIVTAQLQQSYNPEAYKELMEFLSRHSLSDGDKFCADLMRESSRHKSLVLTLENFACLVIGYVGITNDYCVAALRILEVRSAYCKNDFEWDNLERLATKKVDESNTRLMRDYVLETIHGES